MIHTLYPYYSGRCLVLMLSRALLSLGAHNRRAERMSEGTSLASGNQEVRIEAYLVVEPALRLKVVEELAVRLAPPEFHVRDLEVTPNCICNRP